MKCTAKTIPIVDKMMVRKITPLKALGKFGGVIVLDEYDVEDVGLVKDRLDYDEEVVDCSNRIFEITNYMIMVGKPVEFTVFPSRRWRNFRKGELITALPDESTPLLFLGNPIRLWSDETGITVNRESSYLIRSGVQMGY